MFDQNTFGTCIKFAVDGRQIMGLIYHEIREAKSSIWIANYDLDPDLCLIREDDHQKKYFQRSFVESGLVASSCKDKIKEEGDSKNTAGTQQHNYKDPFMLQNLLIEKAKQKVDIKIILWEPRLIVRTLPISKRRRGIEGRQEKAKIIRQLAKDHGVDNYISVQLDGKAPTLTSGYHEKIIIIDNQIGFCGGQDLSKGKWDTSDHSFDNVLRDEGSEPWHDVNVMVKGPIVWYFIFHFNQRWVHSILKSNEWVKQLVTPNSIGAYLSPHFHLSRPSISATNEHEERIGMVALRTWKQIDEKGDGGIYGIREWYNTMFRNARHNIYLEDQFPFQDKIITQSLIKRLKEERSLKVITVGPMDPNLPGLIFGKIAHESINDINNNLSALREAGEGERVKNYSLVSQDPRANEKRKQIYVHSKIMIVDDKWITIGSANTDRDGFEASTEFDLGITSPILAQKLRVKLWTEHMGEEHLQASPSSLDLNDFDEGFQAWEKAANENGERVKGTQAIKGHIYYYNFQEMKFPPPYLGAKGGNRFRWF